MAEQENSVGRFRRRSDSLRRKHAVHQELCEERAPKGWESTLRGIDYAGAKR